ncbi:hypothetical protein D049_2163B, partial [Vibrio parahaemolyticus VPTS-2010]
QEK